MRLIDRWNIASLSLGLSFLGGYVIFLDKPLRRAMSNGCPGR